MSSYDLFSPYKDPDMCLWFYFLSVIGFIFLILSVVSGIWFGISKRKDASFYFQILLVSLGYFIFYFQNRLLYTMCSNVIR